MTTFVAGQKIPASALIAILNAIQADAAFTTAGTLAASSGTEAAMTDWGAGGSTTFAFPDGYLSELRLVGGCYDAGTTGSAGRPIVRVRKGVNNTTGLIVMTIYPVTAGGSQVMSFTAHSYLKNVTGSPISCKFGLTVTKNTGGNAGIYGDGNVPMMLTVAQLGKTTDLPGLAAVAVALT